MGRIDILYATAVSVTGGREGHALSDDGALDVQLRRPRRNGASQGTNPEQLFAAAWGGCFQSALMAAARKSGLDVSDSVVRVEVAQGRDAEGGYALAAKISVDLPSLERDLAHELVAAAHALCPYSRATQGNIEVELNLRSHR